jgi:pSer/pThr/pTyr-binding forkhead associated (FHA) protein
MDENVLSIDIGWQPRVVIGRFDSAASDAPDINLNFLDAAERGVSRRHAALFWQNRVLCIEDLGSTNGTLVNGKKLHPHTAHVLGDGDVVQLGFLQFRLRLDPNRKYPPKLLALFVSQI